MFAPLVAKPTTKAAEPQRSAVEAQWHVRTMPARENEHNAARPEAAPSWDFSRIPVLSSGPTERLQRQPLFSAPRLPGPVQAKLKIGAVDDPLEHEADRVADQVMRMRAPGISATAPPQVSRKCAECEEEDKLQKKAAGPQAARSEAPALVHEVLRSPGQPLDAATRRFFEPRFRQDFSAVRVHTDARAAESARAVNALAYTVGTNIVFASEQYAPGAEAGDRLLAHELAHAAQQTLGNSVRRRRLSGANPDEELEKTPETAGAVTQLMKRDSSLSLRRAPDDKPLQETANEITVRSEEKTWSKTSPGITEQEKPGEKFLLKNFAIDEAGLKKEHEAFLRDTVYFGTLTSDPMASIAIVGHADSTGSKSLNDRLARQRARETEKALKHMGRHNLRIVSVTGEGEKQPVASNDSVFGRAENRRVEILVTPWKPSKPVPEILTDLQKGMKPFVVKVDNFAACPFQDTVKSMVEDAFKPIPSIQFDWEGKSTGAEAFISFDDTSTFTMALGLSGDIFLNSFKNNKICKVPGDATTCEAVFPPTADVMGRALGNTVAHETGHALALDHVPGIDNLMWTPELHPLHGKTNKTFDEKVLLMRTLQAAPETFNASQLVHMVNRIKQQRKSKPGVVDFE